MKKRFVQKQDGAERQRQPETSRHNEELFRKVFEEGPLGMALVGLDYRFFKVNPMLCELTGYTERELTALTFVDITYAEDVEKDVQLAGRLFRGEIPYYQMEKRYVRKNKQIIWVCLSVSVIRDAEGKPLYFLSMIQDITQRKRAEEELRESEERLRLVVANSPDIIFFQNHDLRYTWVINPIPPFTEQLIMGKTDFDLVSREEAQRLTDIKRRVIETGAGTRAEVRVTVGGEKRYYDAVYEPRLDREGRVVGLFGYGREITERKRTEEERERLLDQIEDLRKVAERRAAELQSVLDNMVDGVVATDTGECVTLVNGAARRLLETAGLEEVIGCRLERFIDLLRLRHGDGRPFAREELPLVRALSGEILAQELEVAHNARTKRDVYIRTSAAPIRDEKGAIIGAVEVVRDVTDLTELDRLKDQFMSVAAHELKTPVTGIKGFAQLLLQREHEGVSPQGIKALEAINRQADRIARLVNDLLDISRLQLGRLDLVIEKIDLPEFVEDVVNRMALTATKHHIQIVRATPVVVKGDRDRLEQVLVNLLDNAIKYSPQSGPSQGRIDVAVDVKDQEAIVSVRDYGVGIPKDRQAHVFERFYRAHAGTPNDFGGIGVGLYISREIIARHGGRMWFESEEDKGSIFYFSLPLT